MHMAQIVNQGRIRLIRCISESVIIHDLTAYLSFQSELVVDSYSLVFYSHVLRLDARVELVVA